MKCEIRAQVLAIGTLAAATLSLCLGSVPNAAAEEGDISKVNESVHVDNGEHAGDVSSVNGSIHIGADAVVRYTHTVNGGVSFEPRATADKVESVNGSIHLGEGVRIHGHLRTVNGGMRLADKADVGGDLITVNGGIRVESSHVGGSIDTVAGGIDLGPNAHVDGGIKVEKDNNWHFGFGFWDVNHPPEIIIRPGTVVKGTLHFERPVRLYVSDRATIGAIEGAEAHKFSGDNPSD